MSAKKLVWAAAIVVVTSACASATDDPTGSSSAEVDYICNQSPKATLDGIPAYSWCGNTNVWTDNGVDTKTSSGGSSWVETEGGYGYQCVEYAVRYFYFHWNVSHNWFVGYAKDMCGTHPADVSVTSSPVHGDLAVFTPGACGADATAGHVAAIDTVGGSTISVVQENPAGTYTWNKSCVACYLHASANNSSDPCSSAADGLYCGQSTQWKGGTPDVLYDCEGGVTKSKTTCTAGCEVEPPGTSDECKPVPEAGDADDDAPGDAAPSTSEDAMAPLPPAADASADAPPPAAPAPSGCALALPAKTGLNGSTAPFALGFLALTLLRRRRGARSA